MASVKFGCSWKTINRQNNHAKLDFILHRAGFFCLIIGYNLLCLAYQAGFTASDQMDLLIEQIKMLAGEVAFGTSSLKRLIEQSIDDPEGTKDQVFPLLFIIFFLFLPFLQYQSCSIWGRSSDYGYSICYFWKEINSWTNRKARETWKQQADVKPEN